MRILKIKGKNEQTILQEIKKEYGESALIISSQEERKQGILSFFQKSTHIVTVAVNDEIKVDIKKEDTKMDTKQAFEELKTQLESIRKDINKVSSENHSKEQKNDVKHKLISLLQEEGAQKHVLEDLLGECSKESDMSELIKELYSNLIESLQMDQEELPKIVFFVGSTGVGKTTTIAKLTAKKMIEEQKKVVLFTADTYRIAAIEQLRTYADILGAPLEVIYQQDDLQKGLDRWKDVDHIFIDTAGRSHKNIEQLEEMKKLLMSVENKKIFLVLNISTPYIDIQNIIDTYKEVAGEFELILTKIDETDEIGNLINIADHAKRPIRYIANGQSVPDDIEIFESKDYIKQLLGRVSYE